MHCDDDGTAAESPPVATIAASPSSAPSNDAALQPLARDPQGGRLRRLWLKLQSFVLDVTGFTQWIASEYGSSSDARTHVVSRWWREKIEMVLYALQCYALLWDMSQVSTPV